MSVELLRTQVKDLLDCWTDDEDHERDSLLRLLAHHLHPSQMVDSQQSVKSKITAGPAPWDDPVAHLLADVSSGTRTIERGLDIACGFKPRLRGGSDGNTRVALSRIPDLVDAISDRYPDGSMRELIAEARITIGLWHRSALLLLGAERRWAHLRADVAMTGYNAGILTGRDAPVDLAKSGDERSPCVAACPYCDSSVRIQPDVADDGDKDYWACRECTARQSCLTCTRKHQVAAVDTFLDRAARDGREVWGREIDAVRASVPVVYGCEHVTVYGCSHALARNYPIGEAVAVCVNGGCFEEHDDGRRTRRTWPVDDFLGRLLTWQPDTLARRGA